MNKSKLKKYNIVRYVIFIQLLLLITLLSLFLSDIDLNAEKEKFTVKSHDNTNFPLVGKHRTVPCSECHINGVIKNTPDRCEACHWERKQDDRYNLQLGYHCNDCHTPFDWKKIIHGSWDHLNKSGFKREGIHRTLDCFNCHKSGFQSGLQSECISCHREDYEKEDDPDHRSNGFPEDCTLCHRSQLSWGSAVFNHSKFTLSGVHKTLKCNDCHNNGIYSGTSPECYSCHSEEYNSTKDPDHKKAGFPADCTLCHKSLVTWKGAVFNHSSFILQGGHKSLECSDCHSDGVYKGRSSDCVSCHLKDYDNSRDPNHRNAGFPTSCDYCHSAAHFSWRQAEFNHHFPIKSGKHSGFSCTDCHLTANFRDFSCIDCHEHDKSSMDKEHDDESGYVYNSQNCYSCHPKGIAD